VAAAAAYTALAILLTWPVAAGLAHDVPSDLGDPLLNIWVLAWDCEHLLRALGGHPAALRDYWNANIYYPHPLALAYSEHLTPQAVMALPVYAVTRNPVLSYNVVFLSTFVLSALGLFLFVRDLTGSPTAAFLAGIAFGFAPYRFSALPHLQVLSSMWMPYVLVGFHRFFETGRTPPLALAAGAWIAQNLSCGYYLFFFSPAAAVYLTLELTRRGRWRETRTLARIGATVGAVVAATVPFLVPYWHLRQLGFAPRTLAETGRFSADALAYLTADPGMRLWGRIARAWPKSEGALFPGLAIAALAAIGVMSGWRAAGGTDASPSPPARTRRRWERALAAATVLAWAVTVATLFGWSLRAHAGPLEIRMTSLPRALASSTALLVAQLALRPAFRDRARRWLLSPIGILSLLTVFAFVMSLGPAVTAAGRVTAGWSLYALFYRLVPGFDGLRVPARNGMIVAFGLAALGGYGAAVLARRRSAVLLAALSGLVLAESWAAPIPVNANWTDYRQHGLAPLPGRLALGADTPAVYRRLAALPDSSVILELPFGEVAFEARYMFYSTRHWRRLVNGYSGGSPGDYDWRAERLSDILSAPDEAWRAVAESGATHLVVHEAAYAAGRGQLISTWAAARGARPLGRFEGDRLFELPRSKAP